MFNFFTYDVFSKKFSKKKKKKKCYFCILVGQSVEISEEPLVRLLDDEFFGLLFGGFTYITNITFGESKLAM